MHNGEEIAVKKLYNMQIMECARVSQLTKAMETTGEDNKNIYLKHLQLRTEKVSQQTADKKKLRRQLHNTLHA